MISIIAGLSLMPHRQLLFQEAKVAVAGVDASKIAEAVQHGQALNHALLHPEPPQLRLPLGLDIDGDQLRWGRWGGSRVGPLQVSLLV